MRGPEFAANLPSSQLSRRLRGNGRRSLRGCCGQWSRRRSHYHMMRPPACLAAAPAWSLGRALWRGFLGCIAASHCRSELPPGCWCTEQIGVKLEMAGREWGRGDWLIWPGYWSPSIRPTCRPALPCRGREDTCTLGIIGARMARAPSPLGRFGNPIRLLHDSYRSRISTVGADDLDGCPWHGNGMALAFCGPCNNG
jgi:hypothetical protein